MMIDNRSSKKREVPVIARNVVKFYIVTCIYLILILIAQIAVSLEGHGIAKFKRTTLEDKLSGETISKPGESPTTTTRRPKKRPTTTNLNSDPNEPVARSKSASHPKTLANFDHLYREHIDDYPQDEIDRLLKRTPDVVKKIFFTQVDEISPTSSERAHKDGQLPMTERSGQFNDEGIVCRVETGYAYPGEARGENNERYIVARDKDLVQVVNTEKCLHPNSECSFIKDNLPPGKISTCRQKYAQKMLLIHDPKMDELTTRRFSFPSCCSCYVTDSDFDMRSIYKPNESPISPVNSNHQQTQAQNTGSEVSIIIRQTKSPSQAEADQQMNDASNNGPTTFSLGEQQISSNNKPARRTTTTTTTTRAPKKHEQNTVILHEDIVYHSN